jgi:hypothetical protein
VVSPDGTRACAFEGAEKATTDDAAARRLAIKVARRRFVMIARFSSRRRSSRLHAICIDSFGDELKPSVDDR